MVVECSPTGQSASSLRKVAVRWSKLPFHPSLQSTASSLAVWKDFFLLKCVGVGYYFDRKM